jgi:hypothetical protein
LKVNPLPRWWTRSSRISYFDSCTPPNIKALPDKFFLPPFNLPYL